jgi:protein-L-isoaspartate(D-aspartate) O-methyltransferase
MSLVRKAGGKRPPSRLMGRNKGSRMTIVKEAPAMAGNTDIGLAARKAMIDSQLRTSGVNAEFVLRRMMAVAREDHVPAQLRSLAYIDRMLDLGEGRKLAAPVVQGMMLQEAAPTAADRVLLVDGGSGFCRSDDVE